MLLRGISCAASADPSNLPPRSAETARLVARDLPRMHLSHLECGDKIAASALDLYLNALDYDHCYFLATDIASFRAAESNLDDRLNDGNVQFAYDVYDQFKERVSNRVAYVDTLLAKGFDLTEKESYMWKRKDAPWPADEAAWNELWRQRVKNQYVARVASTTLAKEEAAEKKTEAGTNAADKAAATDLNLTPEEFVRKGYRQYLTVLNDNDPGWVLERYLSSFTQAYDPHSDYMSRNNTEDFDISMKLSLVGIGALLSSEDGFVKVERLIPGGPAEKDGRLKPGDKIIAVAQGDGSPEDIIHWPLSKAVRLIRGKKDTKVVLTVIPASDVSGSTTVKINLIRDEVKLEEQAAKSEIREVTGADTAKRRIAVITLPEFYADVSGRRVGNKEPRSSSRDVRAILDGLKTNPVDGVVLDLRNNGGGLLAEAVEMTGLFIDSGPVVQVSDGYGSQVLSDTDPDTVYSGPLVVLVNRLTASASEILAGALQDYGRAVIVGDSKTHGKGTVQTLTALRDSDPALGTLKVTTASFYRIAGGSTQLKGVTPDIVTPSALDSMEVGEEFLPHAMTWTVMYPALYRTLPDLGPLLPELHRRSEERQGTDPRFVAYRKLIETLGERQKTSEISLNLNDRIALARTEQDLQKMLHDADPKDDKKDGKSQDLVLSESLQIVSDLIALQQKPTDVMTAGPKAKPVAVADK